MPIDFSNLSAEDITAATAAVEAARRAHEEKEHWEAEEWRKRQEEEQACQEAIMQREAEQRKEAAARKAEAEQRDRLAREKAAREVAAAETAATVTTGLSGLKLTIPAPASIACMASGSSTQSKGKRKAAEEEPSTSQCVTFIPFSFLADFLWRSRFPSCDSCTIISIPCSMELRKNGTWWTSCDRCRQLKKVCHWDLVGVTGPQDPNAPKRARKMVKKPVIDVDDLEDSGDEAPSPSTDLMASVFAVRNAANALVTELATVRATLVQFQDTLTGSLARLTEFMVKEQAEVREDRRAVQDLLQ
jgi:hypothetical protein